MTMGQDLKVEEIIQPEQQNTPLEAKTDPNLKGTLNIIAVEDHVLRYG